jgi:hypothetical protein
LGVLVCFGVAEGFWGRRPDPTGCGVGVALPPDGGGGESVGSGDGVRGLGVGVGKRPSCADETVAETSTTPTIVAARIDKRADLLDLRTIAVSSSWMPAATVA